MDTLLQRAVNSVTIIPRNKFLCMESVRARLHCNIAWALLRLDALERGDELPKVEDDNILKEASDAAKKALDIYDELINGPKILREGGISDDDGAVNKDEQTDETGYTNEDVENKKKFERLLKEEVKARKDQEKSEMGSPKPNELPLSPLWVDYHRSESARALGLLAHCYAQAGAAVTSEGLFQSALDASSSYPFGQRLGIARNSNNNDGVEKGVSRSSPSLGFIARDVRLCYASLCDNWEKRQGDADRLRLEAMKIQEEGVLKDFMASDDMESGRKDGIDATVQASKKMMSGIVTSLWLLNPLDFER